MPNYKVKMGYGLHSGDGIEGSIGSVYKIDASYLSPNVNMASRLEGATKQFGVPLLIRYTIYYILYINYLFIYLLIFINIYLFIFIYLFIHLFIYIYLFI